MTSSNKDYHLKGCMSVKIVRYYITGRSRAVRDAVYEIVSMDQSDSDFRSR